MENIKKVVFKVHSSYSLFTASIIGLLYYDEYERIVVMSSGDASYNNNNQIINSGVFNKILFVNHRTTLKEVEMEVDKLIKTLGAVDELFIAAYELPFERILEKKINNKVILNLIPEGCGAINYQIKIHEQVKRITGKQGINVELEKRYPVDFYRFDRNWTYDFDMPHGPVKIPLKYIDVSYAKKNTSIINKINTVFNYVPDFNKNKMIFYIDVNFSNLHRMNMELECKLIDVIFSCIGNNRVIVKPHPTQDYYFEKMKFDYDNVEIFNSPQIPFELIYLNLLSQYETTDITIIDPMTSTATWSALLMSGKEDLVTIVSYNQIDGLELHEFDRVLYYKYTHDYYMQVLEKKDNIYFYEPCRIEDLKTVCRRVFKSNMDEKEKLLNSNIPDNEYNKSRFNIIGNLFSKSLIAYDNESKIAWFIFDSEKCRIKYYINDYVKIHNLLWFPSDNNIFWRFHDLSIIIGNDGKELLVNNLKIDENLCGIISDSDGSVVLNVDYEGNCNYLIIECVLDVRNVYLSQAELISSLKWKTDFWKRWYYCEKRDSGFWDKAKKNMGCIWIYGSGEIGELIGAKLRLVGIDVYYIESYGKTKNGKYVYGMDELYMIEKKPAVIVVTPMYDFIKIYLQFPTEYRSLVKSINDFMDELDFTGEIIS